MAKKKSAPSTRKKPIASSKSTKERVFSNEGIGYVAGDLWRLLSDKKEHSLAAIKKSIDAPGDVVVAGLGWLAREDKLKMTKSGRSVKVSLQ